MQYNDKWGSKELDCINEKTKKHYTIAKAGCALTSGAMVLGITPLKHWQELNDKDVCDCPYSFSTVADKYGKVHKSKGARDSTDRFDSLKKHIFNYIYYDKIPVIARLSTSNKDDTHFVVIKGFEGEVASDKNGLVFDNVTEDMFKVNDPGYVNNITLEDSLTNNKYSRINEINVMY